jgi:predicted methyltransferase
MNRKWILAGTAFALLAAAPVLAKPTAYDAAIADSARPDTDKQLDAERKPAEMLALAHVKPGMKVMDLIPGHGYFTRLFSVAVGPKGYVYAYQPSDLDSQYKGKEPSIYAVAKDYKNVAVIHAPVNKAVAPEALDLVWTSQNYHDLKDSFFAPADTAQVNKAVFDSLKHGGFYIVLDHAAEKGSGVRDTDTLHRIDEDIVKKEVLAAGFKLAGESNVLRNKGDDHKLKVFDPSIRHKTDQFILIFRKP